MYTIEIIKDTFWILEDAGVKLGTIRRHNESTFDVILKSQEQTLLEEKELLERFGKSILNSKTVKKVEAVDYGKDIDTVGTYPSKHKAYNISSVNINDKKVPVYTKTENSKVYYAAGYYGLHFENKAGWKNTYCVKLDTLQTYEFIGPFRTKSELEAEINRRK